MSISATNAVWHNSESRGAARLVMLCLAWHMDDDIREAFPSLTTIETETGISVRQVQRAINWLIDEGELEVISGGLGRGNSYRYRFLIDVDWPNMATRKGDILSKGDMVTPYRIDTKGDILSQKGDILSQKGDILSQKGDILSDNDTMTPDSIYINNKDIPTNAYYELQAAVCNATKKKPELLDALDLREIDGLFKAGFTAAQVKQAFSSRKTSWWYTANWKGKKGQYPKLKDITDHIGEAVEWHTSPPPTPNGATPHTAVDTAWQEVKAAVGQRGKPQFSDPAILEAINAVPGGWATFKGENFTFIDKLKPQFERAYEQIRTITTP